MNTHKDKGVKIKEVEFREKITFKSSGDFMTVYDKQLIEYKDANGKWHKWKTT